MTRANVGQLIARYFEVVDVDVQTLRGYRSKYKNDIKPLLETTPLSKLGQIGTGVEILDSFYAELRRCHLHYDGKEFIEHRTTVPHQCDEHEGNRCPRNNPQECRRCRRMCKSHVCKGLGDSTIRQIHWTLSGALDRAVVWGWIAVNPAEHASKPGLPTPDPHPPTVEEIGRLLTEGWEEDEDWGAFLSTKTTTGNCRGEMCALRWSDRTRREGARSVLSVRRSIFVNDAGQLEEKDTKTHQQRRIVMDPEPRRGPRRTRNTLPTARRRAGHPIRPERVHLLFSTGRKPFRSSRRASRERCSRRWRGRGSAPASTAPAESRCQAEAEELGNRLFGQLLTTA